jgi:hypothetical protein
MFVLGSLAFIVTSFGTLEVLYSKGFDGGNLIMAWFGSMFVLACLPTVVKFVWNSMVSMYQYKKEQKKQSQRYAARSSARWMTTYPVRYR